MWVMNLDRDVLINLNSGLRIAIMPTNKKEGEAQLYGVVVQTPTEATLPVGRPLPTGYSNTVLLSGAPLDDCQNLLRLLHFRLEAFQVPNLPIDIDEPEPVILTYVDELKISYTFVCEDEATAMKLLYDRVASRWKLFFETEIPQNWEEAIDAYYDHAGTVESRKISPGHWVAWKDVQGKRRWAS